MSQGGANRSPSRKEKRTNAPIQGYQPRNRRRGLPNKADRCTSNAHHSRACTMYPPAHHLPPCGSFTGANAAATLRGPNLRITQPLPAMPSNRSCVPCNSSIIHVISASKLPWRCPLNLGRLSCPTDARSTPGAVFVLEPFANRRFWGAYASCSSGVGWIEFSERGCG